MDKMLTVPDSRKCICGGWREYDMLKELKEGGSMAREEGWSVSAEK